MGDIKTLITSTDKQAEAIDLHYQIKASGETAATAMVDFCRGLKKMRDEEMYLELGCESFGDYAETYVGIGQSQAYAYVLAFEKLGAGVLEKTAKLGITKLKLLTQMSGMERDELIESGEAADMTVKQLAEFAKKLADAEEELEEAKATNKGWLETAADLTGRIETIEDEKLYMEETEKQYQETVEALQAELKAEKQKPIPVAVSVPDPEEMKKKIASAVEKERKRLNDEMKEAVKTAEERATEKAKKDIGQTLQVEERAKKEAMQKAEELERKLKLTGSPETLKFSIFIEALQTDFNKLNACILETKAMDEEKAGKFTAALNKLLSTMIEALAYGE